MSKAGVFIKKRREELGITQTELADLVGETKQNIWKYESGTITNIPLSKVEVLAAALRCSPSDIAGWTKAEPIKPENSLLADQPSLTPDESDLLNYYRSMNDAGQRAALAMVKGLSEDGLYKKYDRSAVDVG